VVRLAGVVAARGRGFIVGLFRPTGPRPLWQKHAGPYLHRRPAFEYGPHPLCQADLVVGTGPPSAGPTLLGCLREMAAMQGTEPHLVGYYSRPDVPNHRVAAKITYAGVVGPAFVQGGVRQSAYCPAKHTVKVSAPERDANTVLREQAPKKMKHSAARRPTPGLLTPTGFEPAS
jgi:hypothetical protein